MQEDTTLLIIFREPFFYTQLFEPFGLLTFLLCKLDTLVGLVPYPTALFTEICGETVLTVAADMLMRAAGYCGVAPVCVGDHGG